MFSMGQNYVFAVLTQVIYVYVYVRVCVCVCVGGMLRTEQLEEILMCVCVCARACAKCCSGMTSSL